MDLPPAIRVRVTVVLTVALLGISSSAVLVRMMDAGPAAIAAWRCLFAAVLLSPGLPAARSLSSRDALWVVGSGLFLGLHFGTWFASLDHTTVLRSTLFVATVPVWTALLEWAFTGRRPSTGFGVGVAIALFGVGLSGSNTGDARLTGDLLALFAGILWAFYLLIGRDVRQRVHVTTYMGLVSLVAALVMAPVAVLLGEPLLGYPSSTWMWLGVATLGPQLLGHQGFSYAVRYVPASTLAALMLLEPVGSTLLAAALLNEMPPLQGILGGGVVLLGVLVALRAG